ncbi:hypothetical protein L2E82_38506 [Cichorium intybus]|uniref:Uncharacterized protein n=1 Tax=Cichorium intybus TaxID=13427 RepID=A0ACB9AKG3_CICIN|nr:hypothetical protein L2E82_38506 [Cichorium intybus]
MGSMDILPALVEGGSDGAGAGAADGGWSRGRRWNRLKEICEISSASVELGFCEDGRCDGSAIAILSFLTIPPDLTY